MKKQELIHLHGLLAEVAEYCASEGIALDLQRYREAETNPMSINHAKGDHEEAVLALSDALATALGGADEESIPVSAD